jgi:ligand-binding sensor domain-containing protein/DNA-binding CsgD family transcriptional regulator
MMRNFAKYRGFFVLKCVFWTTLVHGDLLYAQPKNYFFESLTIGEGLSHNTVYVVLQDRRGFMWIGTQNGLNKYDGYGYKVYRTRGEADPQFEGRAIYALLEDREGNIWVGTQKDGLNVLSAQTGRFRNLKNDPLFKEIANAWICALFEDREGRIWIGTQEWGGIVYDPKTQKSQHFFVGNQQIGGRTVFDFAQDERGKVWIATGDKYLSYYDPNTHQFVSHVGNLPIEGYRKTLLADQKGSLWVGAEGGGLYQLNLNTADIRPFTASNSGLSSNNIRDIEVDGNKRLLIATDGGGLNVFSPSDQTFQVFKYNPLVQGSLNTDALFDILPTPDGNVWIGTYNGGVNVYKAHKLRFDSYTHTGNVQGELSHRSVLSLLQTRNGQIWVGTDGGGLNKFDPQTKSFSALRHQANTSQSLNGDIIKSLYEDVNGNIWIGIYSKGLDCFNPQTNTFKHYEFDPNNAQSLSNSNVWAITGTPQGIIWAGTLGRGLNAFDPQTGVFTRFLNDPQNASSIAENDIMTLLYDHQNRLWIGTANKGLDLYDVNRQKFIHFRQDLNKPFSLRGNEVRAIFEDHQGRLWIGTEDGGLNMLRGHDQFDHYTTSDGLLSDSIMGITEDEDGNIWVSTFSGLSKINTAQKKIQNFDFNNGQRANQFNQSAILWTKSGELMAGGINSLNVLNNYFTYNHTDKPKPNVFITDLKVFNRSILAGVQKNDSVIYTGLIENAKIVYLSYLDNVFSIDVASSDLDEPNNNRYVYKLEGFDDQWHSLSPFQHTANFTNIAPGDYTFRVKSINSSGSWSTQEAVIKIVIIPPFWKTWWFRFLLYILAALIGLGLIRLFVQRRERHLHEKMLQADAEILRLQNQNLTTELSSKNLQLVSIGLQMGHKNDFLNKMKQRLKDTIIEDSEDEEQKKLVRRIMRMVDSEVKSEGFWNQFNVFFNEVNKNFTKEIRLKHPDLSPNDIRLCSLIVIDLNTKEVASILNITPKGVEKSRYRLKKKLGLTAEDDLYSYLKSFN